MRIFYSPDSDPMLLDSAVELNFLHERLAGFLGSSDARIVLPAETTSSPAPFNQFLLGLRIEKTQGLVSLQLAKDGWLELTGTPSLLSQYISHFRFEPVVESGHHHPDNAAYMARGTLCLIIEADSTWDEENAG